LTCLVLSARFPLLDLPHLPIRSLKDDWLRTAQQRSVSAVKNFILALTAAACLFCAPGTARAQNKPAAAQASLPLKIALVDMARVFKEYRKFQDLREGLKVKMEARMAEAQKLAADAKTVSEELKLLKAGSAQFISKEARLAELTTKFDTQQKLARAEYIRSESTIFEQVYVEARDVIRLYSEHFKYTLVLRFNSQPLDTDNKKPQDVANSLNKLVVYHRAQDDITSAIIEYLNRKYSPTSKTVPQNAQGTKPGTRTN